MENYVEVTLSDGRHARVNKEKIPESVVGLLFVHVLTIVGTSLRYYYRCVDELLNDPDYLQVDIESYLSHAPHLITDSPTRHPGDLEGKYEFKYCDTPAEIFWTVADSHNTVEIKVYHGMVDVAPFRISHVAVDDKKALEHLAIFAIKKALKTEPSLLDKQGHDFIYQDEKVETRWKPSPKKTRFVSIDVAGIHMGVFAASGEAFVSRFIFEKWVKDIIFRQARSSTHPITDAEFEPEDLTTQFIRACQNEFGTNGEITTIIVNTKTKEITVTATIEHKLYL